MALKLTHLKSIWFSNPSTEKTKGRTKISWADWVPPRLDLQVEEKIRVISLTVVALQCRTWHSQRCLFKAVEKFWETPFEMYSFFQKWARVRLCNASQCLFVTFMMSLKTFRTLVNACACIHDANVAQKLKIWCYFWDVLPLATVFGSNWVFQGYCSQCDTCDWTFCQK